MSKCPDCGGTDLSRGYCPQCTTDPRDIADKLNLANTRNGISSTARRYGFSPGSIAYETIDHMEDEWSREPDVDDYY